MSERVLTGTELPVVDLSVADISDAPQFDGTPVTEDLADNKVEVFIPRHDQTVMSASGMGKYGLPAVKEELDGEKEEDLSKKAGSIFHGEGEAAIRLLGELHDESSIAITGLSIATRNERRRRLHGTDHALFRGWAERGARAMPALFASLLPGPGSAAYVVAEPRLYLGKKHKEAAGKLVEPLEAEQRDGDGTKGPIERALLAAASFQLQGKRTGKFAKVIREWPESASLTKTAVTRLTRQARTHMFIKGGNMIAAPTSRPDILEFIYEQGDTHARHAAEALSNVMKKNIGFDPDKLYSETVYFTDWDKASGKLVETPLTALEAVHWANTLIAKGKLTPCVLDIKLQTHAGAKWDNQLNAIWEEHGNSLPKVFSTENLQAEDPKFDPLHEHWYEMERDVAATTYSFLSFLRMAEREFRNKYPGEGEPVIKWDVLAKAVRAAIVLVDFDISKPGEELQHVEGEETVDHATYPPMGQAGVPEDVGVMLRPVEQGRLNALLRGRERRMRVQYIQHKLAQVATQAAMDQAA